MRENVIELGLENEYGGVVAYKEEGSYYMYLDGATESSEVEISEEFYRAIEKEFGAKK